MKKNFWKIMEYSFLNIGSISWEQNFDEEWTRQKQIKYCANIALLASATFTFYSREQI